MRVKFAVTLLILGLIALLLGPSQSQSQQPRGGFGGFGGGFGGRGGGFGGAPQDPNATFDRMARGGNTIKISDLSRKRDEATAWAKKNGITNGEFTRDQWFDYTKSWTNTSTTTDRGATSDTADVKGPLPGAPAIPGGRGFGGRGRSNSGREFDVSSFSDSVFKKLDRNGDGLLQVEEMTEELKAEKDKWDANRDGVIDRDEFREYMTARTEKYQAERERNAGGDPREPSRDRRGSANPDAGNGEDPPKPVYDLDKKIVVLRAGKLGDKMPAWFTEYDLDKDAQVALYEWKEKGGDLNEFRKWDLNGDGFITPDEVLRVLAVTGKDPKAAPGSGTRVASADTRGGGAGGGLGGMFGGMFGGRGAGQGGGRSRGGFGGGGNNADSMFDRFAQGRTTFNISDSGFFKDSLTAYAQKKGLTDTITREQFRDYWTQRQAEGGFGGGGGQRGGGFGGGGRRGNRGPGG